MLMLYSVCEVSILEEVSNILHISLAGTRLLVDHISYISTFIICHENRAQTY